MNRINADGDEMKDKEIRNFNMNIIEVRDGADGAQPMITGEAAVYNSRSANLGGFTEVIEPGFFNEVMNGDTRGLFNHDSNYVLGRTASGTLRLFDNPSGLGFQADGPWGNTVNDLVIAPMKRGDINQCSFQFTIKEGGDSWRELEDGSWERRLLPGGCAELYDVSVVTFPAYEQTSAQARAMFEKIREEAAGDPDPAIHDPADNTGSDETPASEAIRKRKLMLMKERIKR